MPIGTTILPAQVIVGAEQVSPRATISARSRRAYPVAPKRCAAISLIATGDDAARLAAPRISIGDDRRSALSASALLSLVRPSVGDGRSGQEAEPGAISHPHVYDFVNGATITRLPEA